MVRKYYETSTSRTCRLGNVDRLQESTSLLPDYILTTTVSASPPPQKKKKKNIKKIRSINQSYSLNNQINYLVLKYYWITGSSETYIIRSWAWREQRRRWREPLHTPGKVKKKQRNNYVIAKDFTFNLCEHFWA